MPDSTALVPGPVAPYPLERYAGRAQSYAQASKAANTQRAYRVDWADFLAFCTGHRLEGLPAGAETLALYIAALADSGRVKASTIARRLSAISQAHQLAGFPSPTKEPLVRTVMAGVRRVHGSACSPKAPLSPELLRRLLANTERDLRGKRDRALLLIGFSGAFRRSELAALRMDDIRFVAEGLVVTIPKSKTDPAGEGQLIGIPLGGAGATCPIRALREWLEGAAIEEGPIFRAVDRWTGVSGRALEDHRIAVIIKKLAAKAGLDQSLFSGHSLRSGLATAAAYAGASERSIMDQTRHRSVKQVRRYIHRGSLFRDNAAATTGL